MPRVKEICAYFEEIIPSEMKMDFDNVGLLVGINDAEVKKLIIALDITDEVIAEAVQKNADMILSHHPLYFGLKQVSDENQDGEKIVKLIQNGISCLCLHTNLDAVQGGVNDALAEVLGLDVKGSLDEMQTTAKGISYGMGRHGTLKNAKSMAEFLPFVKTALGTDGIRYHDAGKPVQNVALCGGSGGDYVETALKIGCDTLVTADVKYHQFLQAKELGLNLIDADHFCTENVVVPVIARLMNESFPEVETLASEVHRQIVKFI